jgi:hypothetical protein
MIERQSHPPPRPIHVHPSFPQFGMFSGRITASSKSMRKLILGRQTGTDRRSGELRADPQAIGCQNGTNQRSAGL